jgi:GDP/UDP-N,N'-diacetylbacillosamine 2-epimerase (hydrolysing)
MKKTSKVIVLSGSRAEYGLLRPLIKKIENDKDMKLFLILTGMHLSPEFGETIFEVKKDKFKIYDKIEVLLSSNTRVGMTKATGLAFLSFADAFSKINPDILICLGDRFEIFSGVFSAAFLKIPVAHIHGGELTYGAIDEKLRHAITKASELHFATTNIYRKRIIQMGEKPSKVFNVGALGVERAKNIKKLTIGQLKKVLNIEIDKHFFLVTIHPPTAGSDSPISIVSETLKALNEFKSIPIIMSYSNVDAGGHTINKIKEKFCKEMPNLRVIKKTLGHELYINCLRNASVIIGNSSSAVIEAPILGVPSVNIGNRQEGRIMGTSVISVATNKKDIVKAIKKALSLRVNKKNHHEFGDGNTSQKILKRIKIFLKKQDKNTKKFYDIDF